MLKKMLALVASLALTGAVIGAPPALASTTPTVSFTVSQVYPTTGSWVYIHATESQPIDNTTYFVRIRDVTTGQTLQECHVGTTCGAHQASTTAATHTFSVHLDSGRGGPAPYPIVSAPANQWVSWVSQPVRFTGADIAFHTNDDDRDHDTNLTVSVLRPSGGLAAMSILPQGRFPDDSDEGPFAVSPVYSPATYDDLRGGQLAILMGAFGNDTWRFDYTAHLHFSNGLVRTVAYHGCSMSDISELYWPLGL